MLENLVYRFLGDTSGFVNATKKVNSELNSVDSNAARVGMSVHHALKPAVFSNASASIRGMHQPITMVGSLWNQASFSVQRLAHVIRKDPMAALHAFQEGIGRTQGMLAALGGALTARLGYGIGMKALMPAAKFEETNIAFATMLGSAEKAKQTLADLTEFAALTPYEMPEIEQAARGLVMFGETGDEMMETLNILGNAASGTSSNFGEIALIFNQVRGVGKLLTQDFRQLSTRGILSLQDLADHFEVPREEAQKMLSSGKISFEDLRAVLKSLSEEGGRFENMMIKQSQTLNGLWSTLSDDIGIQLRQIGEQVMPVAKEAVKLGLAFTQGLSEAPPMLKTIAGVTIVAGLAIGGMATATAGLLGLFGGGIAQMITFAGAVTGVGTAAAAGTVALYAFQAAVIGLSLGAAAIVGAAVYWVYYKNAIANVNAEVEKSSELHSKMSSLISNGQSQFIESLGDMEVGDAISAANEELEMADKNLNGIAMRASLASQRLSEAIKNGNDAEVKVQTQLLNEANADMERTIGYIKKLKENINTLSEDPVAVEMDEKTEDQVTALIQKLKIQKETFGKSAVEAQMYEWSLKGVNGTLAEQLRTLLETVEAQKKKEKADREAKQKEEEKKKALDNYMKSLELQQKTIGMTTRERQLQQMIDKGLSEDQIKKAKEMIEALEAEEKARKKKEDAERKAKQDKEKLKRDAESLTKEMMTPWEKAQEKIKEYQELHAKGLISEETYKRALTKLREEFEHATDARKKFFEGRGTEFHISELALDFTNDADEKVKKLGQKGNQPELKEKRPEARDEAREKREHDRKMIARLDKLISAIQDKETIILETVDVGSEGEA